MKNHTRIRFAQFYGHIPPCIVGPNLFFTVLDVFLFQFVGNVEGYGCHGLIFLKVFFEVFFSFQLRRWKRCRLRLSLSDFFSSFFEVFSFRGIGHFSCCCTKNISMSVLIATHDRGDTLHIKPDIDVRQELIIYDGRAFACYDTTHAIDFHDQDFVRNSRSILFTLAATNSEELQTKKRIDSIIVLIVIVIFIVIFMAVVVVIVLIFNKTI